MRIQSWRDHIFKIYYKSAWHLNEANAHWNHYRIIKIEVCERCPRIFKVRKVLSMIRKRFFANRYVFDKFDKEYEERLNKIILRF